MNISVVVSSHLLNDRRWKGMVLLKDTADHGHAELGLAEVSELKSLAPECFAGQRHQEALMKAQVRIPKEWEMFHLIFLGTQWIWRPRFSSHLPAYISISALGFCEAWQSVVELPDGWWVESPMARIVLVK